MDTQVAETIFSLFGQIADPLATDSDVLQAATTIRTHMRDILEGDQPAIVLKKLVILGTDVGQRLRQLEEENEALKIKPFCQSGCTLHEHDAPKAENGFYPLDVFMAALLRVRGQSYGWRVDYVNATQSTPNVRAVKNEDIQRWQKQHKVPDWAFEQISLLVWPRRTNKNAPDWTISNYNRLIELYLENPNRKNAEIAAILTEEFNRGVTDPAKKREITENAVKGGIDRMRKQGKLPKKRPKTEQRALA